MPALADFTGAAPGRAVYFTELAEPFWRRYVASDTSGSEWFVSPEAGLYYVDPSTGKVSVFDTSVRTRLTVRVKTGSWKPQGIFHLIAEAGPVDALEMRRVFNMGVGFAMVVAPAFAQSIMKRLRRAGETCWVLGKVRKGGPELQWT